MGQLGEEPKRFMHCGTSEGRMPADPGPPVACITIPEAFCRPSRAQRADIRDSSLARGRVAFRKVIDEFAESDLAGGITHSCQTACRAATIPLPPSLGHGRSIVPFRIDERGRIRTRPANTR